MNQVRMGSPVATSLSRHAMCSWLPSAPATPEPMCRDPSTQQALSVPFPSHCVIPVYNIEKTNDILNGEQMDAVKPR